MRFLPAQFDALLEEVAAKLEAPRNIHFELADSRKGRSCALNTANRLFMFLWKLATNQRFEVITMLIFISQEADIDVAPLLVGRTWSRSAAGAILA